MKKVVLLTGNELRHRFMRMYLAKHSMDFELAMTVCEGDEKRLEVLVRNDQHTNTLRMQHLKAREQSEIDFFNLFCENSRDDSNPLFIAKGSINEPQVVEKIISSDPDLIIAYGCSIVRGELLERFKNRFINVHLGLSPYYRGSGTNFWPLVNGEPELVGATFMHIDQGIDTGAIIHQIRASMCFSDTPVNIGNRLIIDVAKEYVNIIKCFNNLSATAPIEFFNTEKEVHFYRKADYTETSVDKVYNNFKHGLLENYLKNQAHRDAQVPIFSNPDVEHFYQ